MIDNSQLENHQLAQLTTALRQHMLKEIHENARAISPTLFGPSFKISKIAKRVGFAKVEKKR